MTGAQVMVAAGGWRARPVRLPGPLLAVRVFDPLAPGCWRLVSLTCVLTAAGGQSVLTCVVPVRLLVSEFDLCAARVAVGQPVWPAHVRFVT